MRTGTVLAILLCFALMFPAEVGQHADRIVAAFQAALPGAAP